jgi:hypothetical protein
MFALLEIASLYPSIAASLQLPSPSHGEQLNLKDMKLHIIINKSLISSE